MSNYPNLTAVVEASEARKESAAYRSFDADFTHFGQTEADLRLALAAVKDETNWKLPVEAHFPNGLTDDEQALVEDALVFYTGSIAEFHTHPSGHVVVAAAGYYMAIGA